MWFAVLLRQKRPVGVMAQMPVVPLPGSDLFPLLRASQASDTTNLAISSVVSNRTMDIPMAALRSTRAPSSQLTHYVSPANGRSAGSVSHLATPTGPLEQLRADTLRQRIAAAKQTAKNLKAQITAQREAGADTTLRVLSMDVVPPLTGQVQLRAKRELNGHMGKIYALNWASDSRHIVSVSQDGKLFVWDAYTSNKIHALPLRFKWVMDCAYAPSGQVVATCGLENVCHLFRLPPVDARASSGEDLAAAMLQASQPVQELVGHGAFVSKCRFLSEGDMVTASGDHSCRLWDVPTGKTKAEYYDHAADVMGLDTSPVHPALFVSGGCDGHAKLWDTRVAAGRGAAQSFHGHDADINAVAMFPDGNAFATGSEDAACKLFDLRADRAMAAYSNPLLTQPVTTLGFTRSGRLLAVGHDGPDVLVWDTLRTERAGTLVGHESRVASLGASADGQALCTGSWDARLLVWAA